MDLNKQQTTLIFNHLKEGKFLSQNSPNKEQAKLYRYVEKYYEKLKELYEYMGINLKLKNGYCYFSSMENKEQKLSTIYDMIDYLSFFYHYDTMFGVGSRMSISDIENKVKDDVTLKIKLDRLKTLSGDTLKDNITSLLNKMEKRGFIALEDEYLQSYVVLDSCDYLVEFFDKIEIKQ
ncbi:MAG: condensin complex protein MksE [Campylobacterota bacterium]